MWLLILGHTVNKYQNSVRLRNACNYLTTKIRCFGYLANYKNVEKVKKVKGWERGKGERVKG
ncbi:hypothetical protein HMPREF1991_02803 [Hoylesella loescheii DSM 19665 = JCM 12249 = ATCC 15930]|uniref:Uncharacterized protein n=1 Tax=Hoylesella loescheii DSM 19665 = JCM 12249 = ATCC 15930 TaxID=1122985 RepID=A0A069QE84_HOYLO|nr:hypothetical protein HMPREF1991_02803 [Hoylesella loescheii DSM 19665 = JCM 12249 = ATCC 15930]